MVPSPVVILLILFTVASWIVMVVVLHLALRAQPLLRVCAALLRRSKISFNVSWIPGSENDVADYLWADIAPKPMFPPILNPLLGFVGI